MGLKSNSQYTRPNAQLALICALCLVLCALFLWLEWTYNWPWLVPEHWRDWLWWYTWL